MRVYEVRRDTGGTKPAGNSVFFYISGNDDYKLGIGDCVCKENISAIKSVAFVSKN
jgi:hypothetical protein